PEPNGLRKSRTGAIYKIPAGDRIPGANQTDAAWQTYQPAPNLVPRTWYELEIAAQGTRFTVDLINLDTMDRVRTTTYDNSDALRGVGIEHGRPIGCVGLQSYPGSPVAFGGIQIK